MAAYHALTASLLVLVFSLPSAQADQIVLANGDRLTGEVVSKSEDTLKFRTEYAGEISVRWKDVVSISTDAPVTVMSADGELRKGRLEKTASGGIALVSKDRSREVSLADIEHINPPPHVAGTGVTYKGRISLLGSASRGNTDDGRIYGEAEFNARAKDYRYHIGGRGEQKEESGDTTAQNYYLAGRYDRPIDDDRFWYLRSSLENDKFKDLTLRATAGGGMGWNLIDTSKTQLSVRGGLDYVVARRTTVPDETYPAFGWGINYSQWLWKDHIELFHDQVGLASLTSAGDVSLRTKTGVRLPLGSGLSANAQVNLDYEGDPGPGRDTTDTQMLVGLGYTF
jgi:putative salt-induced outer membrane protein YdiY